MIYLVSLLFTLFFVVYSKWQFSDDRGDTSGKWHPFGMLMRAWVFIGCFLMQIYPSQWQDYLVAGAINIVAWEIGINVIALFQKPLYIGGTSKMDIALKKYKWYLYFGFLLITVIIKIFIK